MRTVFIYALCEPGTRTVRYIGKSVQPETRLRQHLTRSKNQRTHLGNWLRSLTLPPEMVILREVSEAESDAAEIKYIRIARESLGMRLVNGTAGGDGIAMTSEIKAKISKSKTGCKRPPEFGEAQSRALTGRKHSASRREAQSLAKRGKPLSVGHLEAIRASRKTPQFREKMSELRRQSGTPLAFQAANFRRSVLAHSGRFYGDPHE